MGNKGTKPLSTLTYDEAIKRITENEGKRLRDAFKRYSTNNVLSERTFIKEVIGEGVPIPIAEFLFTACGGVHEKGIAWKELLCGLVLLTRGQREEKLRFIFSLYCNDSGSHILQNDFIKVVENLEAGYISEQISTLFNQHDRVNFEEFKEWLQDHGDCISLNKWILKEPCTVTLGNDGDSPTFYQTLAGVTHLEEIDIVQLEKVYFSLKSQSETGKLDEETLRPLISPPIPLSVCGGVFNAFDENRDNHIDFKEMACGISAATRGPQTERQKFCFKVFDADRDGFLSDSELRHMVDVMLFVRYRTNDNADAITKIMAELKEQSASERGLSVEEYLMWTVNNPLPMDFLNLLFQVCHVVLGLRPMSKMEESQIVQGWQEREDERGFSVGQFWYLISMEWWSMWKEYVKSCENSPSSTSICGGGSDFRMTAGNSSPSGSLKRLRVSKRSQQTSLIEDTVAIETSSNVVVTGISPLETGNMGTTDTFIRSSSGSSLRSASSGSSYVSLSGSSSRSPSNTSCQLGGSQLGWETASGSPNQSPRTSRRYLHPGPIDNSSLIMPSPYKVGTLTGEGAKLKKNLLHKVDYELVPDSLWKALSQWYGGSPALPRQVIWLKNSTRLDLELYPITLRLLRHVAQARSRTSSSTSISTSSSTTSSTWSGMVGGYGAAAALIGSTTGYNYASSNIPTTPKRYLANTATFSRVATLKQVYEFLQDRLHVRLDDMRLWHIKDESTGHMTLIEDEMATLEDLKIQDDDQLLMEVRNKDSTWPEEISNLSALPQSGTISVSNDRSKTAGQTEKGVTGLNNLGNSCFMNAALQCMSNTKPLTQYFLSKSYLYELNGQSNLGRGQLAKRYGELLREIWSGEVKVLAPLKVRFTLGKYAPFFSGSQQHDAQEVLAFLLNGLHEDLNRVVDPPSFENREVEGQTDYVAAQLSWESFISRNKSIIVDLFFGQLVSTITCDVCNYKSVKFEIFNSLSLPLPLESYVYTLVIVLRCNGSVPVQYGLRLNGDATYSTLKEQLSHLAGIPVSLLKIVKVIEGELKNVFPDDVKIKSTSNEVLYAYELPGFPFTADEERLSINSMRSQREAQTFTAIQRSIQPPHPTSGIRSGATNDETIFPSASSDLESPVLDSGCGQSECETSDVLERIISSVARRTPPPERLSITGHTDSGNCSASGSSLSDSTEAIAYHQPGFITAVHRKMMRQDTYFLSSTKVKPILFGLPVMVACSESTTHQDLYHSVWIQVARLVTPLPPSESTAPNHAMDCDDSLGYEFPFVLKAVNKEGTICAWCPWDNFCRGCRIQCSEAEFSYSCSCLAIDWDPTALHLRYQTNLEKNLEQHSSVATTLAQQNEPISLDFCMETFTREEILTGDEKYNCPRCKEFQLARKKLQIFRLPAILVFHLKRFQYVVNRWIKSTKVVNVPIEGFDPLPYLANLPKDAVMSYRINNASDSESGPEVGSGDESSSSDQEPPLKDFHQHRLDEEQSPFDISYNLYGVLSHHGSLAHGHYISYALNPNKKWYIYNDSSTKETATPDTSSAYLLFYERKGLCADHYIPSVFGRDQPERELDVVDENEVEELKRTCCLM